MTDPILVTGGTGLAGRHVISALGQRNLAVLPIGRSPAAGWHVADLTDERAVQDLPAFSAVVHCAGLTPRQPDLSWEDFDRLNVRTTEGLARAALARGATRFVLISTLGQAGHSSQTAVGRRYVVSKHLAERALRRIATGRMRIWILRAASMYGEGDRGSMARLIRSVARGHFVLPGSGRQRKCVLYAGTLGQIIGESLSVDGTTPTIEGAYDLETPTLDEIVRIIERLTGQRALRVPLPSRIIEGVLAAGAHAPIGWVRAEALGAAIALRDVACRGPNAIARHRDQAIPLTDGLAREVEWLSGRL